MMTAGMIGHALISRVNGTQEPEVWYGEESQMKILVVYKKGLSYCHDLVFELLFSPANT